MSVIKCCKDCVAPKRHLGCHDRCPEYQAQKAIAEKQKIAMRADRESSAALISNYEGRRNRF